MYGMFYIDPFAAVRWLHCEDARRKTHLHSKRARTQLKSVETLETSPYMGVVALLAQRADTDYLLIFRYGRYRTTLPPN